MTNAWLGYTPISPEANSNLRKLWHAQDLPPVSFDHWSMEFAREVWQVVVEFMKAEVSREILLQFLTSLGVWHEDRSEQQWAPTA